MEKKERILRHIAALAATALLALPFAACTSEDTPDDGDAVAARITAQIASAGTRASGTAWDIGDSFGLSAEKSGGGGNSSTVADNLKYTTTDGINFTGTPVYFQDTNDVTFTAYYPYDSSAGDIITANTADQSQQKSFDFLFATASANRANPDVNMEFSHRMGQLTFTFLAGNGISDLSGMTATLMGLYMDGQFDKATGEATANTSASKSDLSVDVSGISGATYTAQPLILFPQGDATGKFTVEVTLGGNTYTADVAWPGGALKAGDNVCCDITISKTGLGIGSSTIEAWSAAKAVTATAKHITSTFSDPAQAVIGDLILKDGTFISKDYLPFLTDAQSSEVAGVVFWTTKDTDLTDAKRKTPARLSDDKIMAADYPGCTHGLAVALKNIGYMAWQKTAESVGDFQNSTDFSHSLKSQFKSIASPDGATDRINYILGYQNTQILKAYNKYCKANGKSSNVMLPVDSLSGFEANYPAPAGSTGWFIPSAKEMFMLCRGDCDNIWNAYGNPTTAEIVGSSISAVGGDKIIPETESSYYSKVYSVSTERDRQNSFALLTEVVRDLEVTLADVGLAGKSDNSYVRAVCAF